MAFRSCADYFFNPAARGPVSILLVCIVALAILVSFQENTYALWAGRLSPHASFASHDDGVFTIETAKTFNATALAHILFPATPDPADHSLYAENERTLAELIQCIEGDSCGPNRSKVVLLASSPFRGVLGGERGGEAIWANSTLIALRNMGYSYLYALNLAHMVSLYQIFSALIPVILLDASDSFKCFKDDKCVRRRDRPHGVPIWKMLSFHFWDSPDHPLGAKWTLNPEPYRRPVPHNTTYLGYSVEAQCARQPFIPHAERDQRAYVLAKKAAYFEPNHTAWSPDFYDAAAAAVNEYDGNSGSNASEGFHFLAGVHDPELPNYWPERVRNGGLLPSALFYEAVARSRVLVGVGQPFISPSPYDALCAGVPFINPIHGWSNDAPDDRMAWATQHNPLKWLDPPYVYNVFKGDREGFVRAVVDAVSHPIESYVLPRMRMSAVEQRLRGIVERDWKGEAEVLLEERKKSGEGEIFWI